MHGLNNLSLTGREDILQEDRLPQVMDIWRAAAPSIDFIAPDIYTDEFTWVCKEYTRSGNPLFIPETQRGDLAAMRAFYAFGEFDAGCFAPFGIDHDTS